MFAQPFQKFENPFALLSDKDWETYISSHEPYFTSEPYYETMPWSDFKIMEERAIKAGLHLILRTTSNSVNTGCEEGWIQKTSWIFGYPNHRVLLYILFCESKRNGKLINEMSIKLCLQKRLEIKDVTDEVDKYYCDFIFGKSPYDTLLDAIGHFCIQDGIYYAERYTKINPPSGYRLQERILYDDVYCYDVLKESGDDQLPPSFFDELINNNSFLEGTLDECIFFTFYPDESSTFPDNENFFFIPMLMNLLWLKQIMRSNIRDFVSCPSGFYCLGNTEIEGKFHFICEGKRGETWVPVNHPENIFYCEDYRLTPIILDRVNDEIKSLRTRTGSS